MLRPIYRTFLKGFLTILPLLLTLYLIIWIVERLESLFGGTLRLLLPNAWYIPGMGLILGIVIIFCVGLSLHAWSVRRLWTWAESLVDRVPLVRDIYGSVKQLVAYISGSKKPGASRVVMVTLTDTTRLMGMVTRDDFKNAPDGIGDKDTVAVFLPWSYQVGGFTIYIPRSRIQPLEMSPEAALRWTLTAGVSQTEYLKERR